VRIIAMVVACACVLVSPAIAAPVGSAPAFGAAKNIELSAAKKKKKTARTAKPKVEYLRAVPTR
jgi:hypothetical protein